MGHVVLPLLLLGFASGCTSSPIDLELHEEREPYVFYYEGALYTGAATAYHPNGQVKSIRRFREGKHEGLWVEWYENGQKRFEGDRRDGKADGITTWWYENGQVKQQGLYALDVSLGTWQQFYADGTLKEETLYDRGTKVASVFYDEGGLKAREERYVDGEVIEAIEY